MNVYEKAALCINSIWNWSVELIANLEQKEKLNWPYNCKPADDGNEDKAKLADAYIKAEQKNHYCKTLKAFRWAMLMIAV